MNLFSIVYRFKKRTYVYNKVVYKESPSIERTKTFSRIKDATNFPKGQRIECATLVVIKNITKQSECQQLIDLLETLKPSLK